MSTAQLAGATVLTFSRTAMKLALDPMGSETAIVLLLEPSQPGTVPVMAKADTIHIRHP
jgi:hypothetical protein